MIPRAGKKKPENKRKKRRIRPFPATAGFPDVIVVRYRPRWAAYETLEQQCLHTGTLPSLAYGGKSCSWKYKKVPQERFVQTWLPAQQCWARGGKVLKAIDFDAGPADNRRHRYVEDERFRYWYPLVEWRLDREDCQRIIQAAGLPLPMKSACFFCPAAKKHEILWLQEHHPELLERALRVEQNAQAKLISVKGLTLLLAQGVHPKVVQELLGHSQITLTLKTYSHVVPTLQQEAAAKIDKILRKQA